MYEKAQNLIAAGYKEDSAEVLQAMADGAEWINKAAWLNVDKAEDQYSKGLISQTDYVNELNTSLEKAANSGEMSAEQLEELAEKAEDAAVALAKSNFEKAVTAENADLYRQALISKVANNKEGTEDRDSAVQEWVSSYDTMVSMSEAKASLLSENDFTGKSKALDEDISTLTDKLTVMEATGLKESEEYYRTISKIVDKKKEQLELEKQSLEYEI